MAAEAIAIIERTLRESNFIQGEVKLRKQENTVKSVIAIPLVPFFVAADSRIQVRQLSRLMLRIDLHFTCTEENWRMTLDDMSWTEFLDAAVRLNLEIGYCCAAEDKLTIALQTLCDWSASDFPTFFAAVIQRSFEAVGRVQSIARKRRQRKENEEQLSESTADGVFDSNRELFVLRVPKGGLYSPPEALREFFLPAHEVAQGSVIFIEVDLEAWVKAYKHSLLTVSNVFAFVMKAYDAGLRFTEFPWKSLYCKHDSCENMRLASNFTTDVVEDAQVEIDCGSYKTEKVENWLKFLSSRSSAKLAGLLSLRVPEFALSQFQNQDLTSPSLLLGKGGFGYVYLNVLGCERVVVKSPNPNRGCKTDYFLREVHTMSRLRHPYLVSILGTVQFKGKMMIVLERYEYSLTAGMKQTLLRDMPLSEKLEILWKLASAIERLHKLGVCHFDLKPENVLIKPVRRGGKVVLEPKVSDFGMATWKRSDGSWKVPGFTVGYSAPEQLQGINVGPHCDVWSFAMIACYLIFGKSPYSFLRQTPDDPLQKKRFYLKELCVKQTKPQFPPDFEGNHPQLAALLQQCWLSDTGARPTMSSVLCTLKDLKTTYQSRGCVGIVNG